MMRIVLLALIFIFVLPEMANAQSSQSTPTPAVKNSEPAQGPHNEKPIPLDLQGIWSAPDCTAAKQIFVISPHYALFSRRGLYKLGAIQLWRQEDDDGDILYNFKTNTNGPALIKKTNDGLMKFRLSDVNEKAPLTTGWSSTDDRTAPEFAHCAKLFDTYEDLGQDEINAVFLLDTVLKGCEGVTAATFPKATACHQAMFDIADLDHSKSLDHVELARIYRQVAFVMSASVYCSGIGYPDNSAGEAEDFATNILGSNPSITMDQIVAKLANPALLLGSSHTFLENARSTQLLLPFMPEADKSKVCPLDNPETMKELGTVPLVPDTTPQPQ